jgi:hypothetical protein
MRRALSARLVPFTALVLLGSTATECDPAAALSTIWYEQVGGCQGAGSTFAGTGAAYIAFRVNSIDNTMPGARTFGFDPNRLYINTDPRSFVQTSLGTALHHPFVTTGQSVAAGSTAPINGAAFAIVDGPTISGGTIEKFTLYYDTPAGGQGVIMKDEKAQTSTFPYRGNCQQLSY